MSSCYSGTKIFPASTLPCKKGTVKTGDRISHNKTSNSQGPPRLSGILQPDVSGSQAWKQMETSDRFVKSKHFHKVSKIYHGDTRTNQIGNTSQRLGHIPRFVGRIPTCPDSSELSEISEICLPGTGVGVQSSAIWALSSPMVVHTHSTGGESSSTEKRHINAHLSRRLAIKVPVETHIDQANAVDPKNVSVFGTADKYGQVRIEPLSGFRVPGLQVSNSVTQSAAITQESPSHLRNGSSFYPKRPKHSKVLDVSVRAPQCYRKTSSYGQTTPSQYTTLSKRSMECEIAQPALSSTIKSVGFDRSAVVDDVQTCTSFLPHSSITANPSSLHGRLSGRVGCSLQRESCFGHMGTTVGTQTHLNLLELQAIVLAMIHWEPEFVNQVVLVATDNTTVVAYINKQGGTLSRTLCQHTVQLLNWCHHRRITLRARHIPGSLNVIADGLSRRGQILPTEWALNPQIFKAICRITSTPLVDLFATKYNHKLANYVSPVPDNQAWGIDALSMSWSGMWGYAYPPTPIISQVLNKISSDQCKILLIAPAYPRTSWYQVLLKLSIMEPIRLPPNWNLLKQPKTNKYHMSPESLNLHAWLLSGNQLETKAFRKKLPCAYQNQSGPLQQGFMTPNGECFLLGVVENKLIQSIPLFSR